MGSFFNQLAGVQDPGTGAAPTPAPDFMNQLAGVTGNEPPPQVDELTRIKLARADAEQKAQLFQQRLEQLANQRAEYAGKAMERRKNEQEDFQKYLRKSYEDKFNWAGKAGPAVSMLTNLIAGAANGVNAGLAHRPVPMSIRDAAHQGAAQEWKQITDSQRAQEDAQHKAMLEQQNLLGQQGMAQRAQAVDLSRQAAQLETQRKNENDFQWRLLDAATKMRNAKTNEEKAAALAQYQSQLGLARLVGIASSNPAMYAQLSEETDPNKIAQLIFAGTTDAAIKQAARNPLVAGTKNRSSAETAQDPQGGWHNIVTRQSEKQFMPRPIIDPAAAAQQLTGKAPTTPTVPPGPPPAGPTPLQQATGQSAARSAKPAPNPSGIVSPGWRVIGNKAMETQHDKEILAANESARSIADVQDQVDNLLRSRVRGPNGALLTENIFGPLLGNKYASAIREALGVKGGDESTLDLGLLEKAFATAKANVGSGRLAQQEVKMFQNSLASKHEDYDSVLSGLTALRLAKELDAYRKERAKENPGQIDKTNYAKPIQEAMDKYLTQMRELRRVANLIEKTQDPAKKQQLESFYQRASSVIKSPGIHQIISTSLATGAR